MTIEADTIKGVDVSYQDAPLPPLLSTTISTSRAGQALKWRASGQIQGCPVSQESSIRHQ